MQACLVYAHRLVGHKRIEPLHLRHQYLKLLLDAAYSLLNRQQIQHFPQCLVRSTHEFR